MPFSGPNGFKTLSLKEGKMRYSLGILKPDCTRRGLVEKAFELVRGYGLKILFTKKMRFKSEDAEFLYSRCRGSNFFGNLVEFMTSGEVILYLVEVKNGDCAIKKLNKITGYTNPADAQKGTLRSLGIDLRENIAHSTADEYTFWSEIRHFLTKEEISELKLEL